jgi:hypothetical protein
MTRLDYCQFLLVSQINYTLIYFADHHDDFSHVAVNRDRRRERITPRLILAMNPTGYIGDSII